MDVDPTRQWRRLSARQQSILIGAGVVAGVNSPLGFAACCCLGAVAGGVLAAQQYGSRTDTPIDTSDGIVVGVLAGAWGAVGAAIIELVFRLVGVGVEGTLRRATEVLPGSGWEVSGGYEQGPWTVVWFVGELGVEMVVYAIFGAIGGAIGEAAFGSD
jgi:hypothetical protein